MKIKKENITIDGINICYRECGQKENKVLFFLHGWGGNSFFRSNSIIKKLSKKYLVIFPEFPAFMHSEMPKENWAYKEYATFLNSFINKLNPNQKVNILSYSFSGGMVLNYIKQYGVGKIEKLILLDAVLTIPYPGLDLNQKTAKFEKIIYSKKTPFIVKKSLFKLQMGNPLSSTTKDNIDAKFNFGKHLLLNSRVGEINIEQLNKIPILIIWGDKDLVTTPVGDAISLNDRLSSSKLKILKGSHLMLFEKPKLVLDEIFKFI